MFWKVYDKDKMFCLSIGKVYDIDKWFVDVQEASDIQIQCFLDVQGNDINKMFF